MGVPDSLLLTDRQQRTADWADTIQPVVWSGQNLYEFPRPVRRFRFRDTWDFDRFKVPLKDGESIVGQSRKGVAVVIEGQIAHRLGEDTLTEADMFAEIETMRAILTAAGTAGKFELFLFHDTETSYFRKFKNCSMIEFELDLSNRTLFSYAANIHSEDPKIYVTPPGE